MGKPSMRTPIGSHEIQPLCSTKVMLPVVGPPSVCNLNRHGPTKHRHTRRARHHHLRHLAQVHPAHPAHPTHPAHAAHSAHPPCLLKRHVLFRGFKKIPPTNQYKTCGAPGHPVGKKLNAFEPPSVCEAEGHFYALDAPTYRATGVSLHEDPHRFACKITTSK